MRIRVLGLGSLCPDGRAACCNSLRDTGMEIGMPFVWSMGVEKCFVKTGLSNMGNVRCTTERGHEHVEIIRLPVVSF